MYEQAAEAAKQNPLLGLVVLAAGAAYGLWSNRHLLPSVATLTGWLPKWTPAKPDRKAALGKCDDLIAYLESISCPEGVEYFKAGLPHLYHKHGA